MEEAAWVPIRLWVLLVWNCWELFLCTQTLVLLLKYCGTSATGVTKGTKKLWRDRKGTMASLNNFISTGLYEDIMRPWSCSPMNNVTINSWWTLWETPDEFVVGRRGRWSCCCDVCYNVESVRWRNTIWLNKQTWLFERFWFHAF